ncbi:MAG: DUF2203 domain-containing protein [Bacteroidota bacterium]
MPQYLHSRHFTIEEARKELTAVHAIVSRLIELKASLAGKGWDVQRHAYFGGRGPNGDGSFPPEMELLVDLVKSLDARGILVKGIDEGLVDFPHLRADGEEVYLCWKVGEDDIRYWHRLADGFSGRRSIDDL